MRAIKIEVYSLKSTEKRIFSNANETIEFLKGLDYTINTIQENKINQAFKLLNKGEELPYTLISIGNNNDAHIYLEDITGKKSAKDIKHNSKEIIKKVKSKYRNLDLILENHTTDKQIWIEGGFKWYCSKYFSEGKVVKQEHPTYRILYKESNIDVDVAVTKISQDIEYYLQL